MALLLVEGVVGGEESSTVELVLVKLLETRTFQEESSARSGKRRRRDVFYLPLREELALVLPGEAMQPQHVMKLLPRQTEVRVIGLRVRVCGVIAQ